MVTGPFCWYTHLNRGEPSYLNVHRTSSDIHHRSCGSELNICEDSAVQIAGNTRIPKEHECLIIDSDETSPSKDGLT